MSRVEAGRDSSSTISICSSDIKESLNGVLAGLLIVHSLVDLFTGPVDTYAGYFTRQRPFFSVDGNSKPCLSEKSGESNSSFCGGELPAPIDSTYVISDSFNSSLTHDNLYLSNCEESYLEFCRLGVLYGMFFFSLLKLLLPFV